MNKQALDLVLPSDRQAFLANLQDAANAGLSINGLVNTFIREADEDSLKQAIRANELQAKALQRAQRLMEKADDYKAGFDAGHTLGHAAGYQHGLEAGYEQGLRDAQQGGRIVALALPSGRIPFAGGRRGGAQHAVGDR